MIVNRLRRPAILLLLCSSPILTMTTFRIHSCPVFMSRHAQFGNAHVYIRPKVFQNIQAVSTKGISVLVGRIHNSSAHGTFWCFSGSFGHGGLKTGCVKTMSTVCEKGVFSMKDSFQTNGAFLPLFYVAFHTKILLNRFKYFYSFYGLSIHVLKDIVFNQEFFNIIIANIDGTRCIHMVISFDFMAIENIV